MNITGAEVIVLHKPDTHTHTDVSLTHTHTSTYNLFLCSLSENYLVTCSSLTLIYKHTDFITTFSDYIYCCEESRGLSTDATHVHYTTDFTPFYTVSVENTAFQQINCSLN